jgi:hypothetical protein
MLILLPFNIKEGLSFGDWYRNGVGTVQKDISTEIPRSMLVERHRDFLISWWDETQLTNAMQMLHDAGIEPFSNMKEDTLGK